MVPLSSCFWCCCWGVWYHFASLARLWDLLKLTFPENLGSSLFPSVQILGVGLVSFNVLSCFWILLLWQLKDLFEIFYCWFSCSLFPNHFLFWYWTSYTVSFVDYDGYSISSKGFLPTVVDIMVFWCKFTHSSPF